MIKLEGCIYKEHWEEQLEIITFKGFSRSTKHSMEIDLEKSDLIQSLFNEL